jgi:hypothetical protein
MLFRTVIFSLVSLLLPGTLLLAQSVRFNRDVRPILSGKCSKCHGPDDTQRQAELRLDKENGILHAFDGGLNESEGWARVTSTDPDLVMPPPDSHLQLTDDERTTLQAWIKAGAQWEGHWSFLAPVMPPVPEMDDESWQQWTRNPIDAFVLQRLRAADLAPNNDASREILLRRVSLDLTGLPPTLDDIDAFLADTSETAYDTVVDRLLASPHFGERMAVSWMDAARYGDTSVFHADGPRDMWPWRDWVIQAYNKNMPFDQFTREQLAGDLLPNPSTEQMVATGFLRNNATTDEGGLIEEEYRVEYAIDRVKTTSMVWLGVSMECAQCHNHKYDPITQEEYYQFYAFFNQAADPGKQTRNGNQSPVVDLFDDEKISQADELQPQLTAIETRLAERSAAAEADFQKWSVDEAVKAANGVSHPADPVSWIPLDETKGRTVADVAQPNHSGQLNGPEKWTTGHAGNAFECDSNNWIDMGAAGNFDGSHGFSYGCWVRPQDAGNGSPIARMNLANGYRGYDIHLANGSVAVHLIHSWPNDAIKIETKKRLTANEWQHIFVTYDASKSAAGLQIYVNGELWESEVREDRLKGTILSKGPFFVGRRNTGSNYKGFIDDIRIYDRKLSPEDVASLAGTSTITPLLAKTESERSAEEKQTLRSHFLKNVDPEYQAISVERTKLSETIAELRKPIVNVMVMNDLPEMRETFVLARGNYAAPLKDRKVQPNVPAALPALPTDSSANRLGMANWITSPEHPLTARVAVNRYWSLMFGQGIVRSLEDFGARGDWPSHPELLDWLATEFTESNWNVQRTLKQIVMSSTYRQSSVVTPAKLTADPENRLLSRGARFRLQAEFVRDNALAACGLLIPTVGGPGVKPYQPDGLWNEVSLNGNLRFTQDQGDKLYRRSMYTYWRRSAPAPSMTIFDAPTREKCAMRRSRTNTPLQALVTLNDVQFVEASRALAELALKQGGSTIDEQIRFAFRRAAATQPSDRVLAIFVEALDEELQRFQQDTESATQLISTGDSARDESLNPAIHAAMTVVTSMILNLDQTLTRN